MELQPVAPAPPVLVLLVPSRPRRRANWSRVLVNPTRVSLVSMHQKLQVGLASKKTVIPTSQAVS